MHPVSAAIAAELVVVIAIFMGAAIVVNGHTLWGAIIGLVQ